MKATNGNGRAAWFDKEVSLVERPVKPAEPTMREKAITLMAKTLDGKHDVKVPKSRIKNIIFLYEEARQRKLRMTINTKGNSTYLRWEKTAKTAK
jgi:hypothetical protein